MSVIYNTSVVRDGLVLYLDPANKKSYPGTGTVWTDLSGNGNNGILINSPTYSTINGGIFLFNGTTQYVNISNQTNLSPSVITLEAWIFPTMSSYTDGHIIRKEGSYILAHAWTGNLYTWFQTTGGWIGLPGPIFTSNTWSHIVGTWGTTNRKIFLNGVEVASNTTSGISLRTTTTDVLINGAVANSSYQQYNSSLVRIYNRELSSYEIQQNFNALRGRYGI